MKTVFHPAGGRGFNSFGWLNSYHSFSFGKFHNAEKMNFGLLRVLNDDHVEKGMGFGTHPHDNMEIVSIPLSGALIHNDSTGREAIIKQGDVQIMSAGTGISHSEYNASKEDAVKFLQIWVFPKEVNIAPRYEQKSFTEDEKKNNFLTVVSPEKDAKSIWINQDAYFSLGNLDAEKEFTYQLKDKNNGVYIFLLEGGIETGQKELKNRDAIGIYEITEVKINTKLDSKVLIIEVPMG
ncbi:MAG: pirin family protein [Bacteroidetes bacterium]|nr:pirin family protein [Bacteroidota bacterium]MBU1373108.1 pirin family protein [Bacteroidota bacterium]MBU1484290.1 pirin family protein [Bacteroidota bacterium]MBU1762192.1 pirin family protein [Bacteroidota bacterium]MBU2045793.1 pirin family protein [Bacteroidota bacterium]